ncbi:DNA-binding transcriptional response regulator [Sapientia aquatica]|uniref:Response regulator n=1 Tax=Sapientia aquatica TaxID=1549640 RepID=A0A4R5VUS5_9BURK|nr:response regulator [Sapientia aquatica]TDK62789.1 response regulator [Sapientia aquatica]
MMIDELVFASDDTTSNSVPKQQWNILIIDDDMDVHTNTSFALKNVRIHDRSLNLIHAFSSIDGIAFLNDRTDIHLILLDMVMETHDAGLKVARWLDENSDRALKPIVILRTGHPGLLTTNDILASTHFDGMIEKSRVTYRDLIDLLSRMLPEKSS